MKTPNTLTVLVALSVLTCGSVSLRAQISDATLLNPTIATNQYGTDPRGISVAGYVTAGDVASKTWDLEAFGYNPGNSSDSSQTLNSLIYVAGFNPITGESSTAYNYTYHLGDIFLSTGPLATNSGGTTANSQFANPGYNYAIHFSPAGGSNINYTIYSLTDTAELQTVKFQSNISANSVPFQLVQNGVGYTAVTGGSGTIAVQDLTDAQVSGGLGINIGTNDVGTNPDDSTYTDTTNYVMDIPLGSLTMGASPFLASLTEECGNDYLFGSATEINVAVPEPGSLYYSLAGVLILCGFGLIRRKLQA